jgi:regulator of RNase E activity RraB
MEELKLERISNEAIMGLVVKAHDEFKVKDAKLIFRINISDDLLVAEAQLQADQQVVDKLVAEITQLKETIKSYHDTYVKGGNTGFKL